MTDEITGAEVSKRYQTLSLDKIDQDYISARVRDSWRKGNDARDAFLRRREEYTGQWRDLSGSGRAGPWEGSAQYHVPVTLIYGKAIHARLWQIFSDFGSMFGVKARQEQYQEKEQTIKDFMTFVLDDHCNSKNGARDTFDEFLWDNVFEGSGYLKLYWHREVSKYLEVVPAREVTTSILFDRENLTGRSVESVEIKENEEVREEILETPQIRRILMEDIILPVGQNDPQDSDWVCTRVLMSDDALKQRARDEAFDKDAVSDAISHRTKTFAGDDMASQIKSLRNQMDGYEFDASDYSDDCHVVMEWYGKAYVQAAEVTSETDNDLSKFPQEIVVWQHKATQKILGWTYLHRISPSGMRPIFKSDFIRFPDRSTGVGVAEVMFDINLAIDNIYNMRIDNGTIASIPMGVYRQTGGLKPDKIQIQPGELYGVDDVNDIRLLQFPFLQGFGYQEEDRLTGYGEKLLTVSDLNLGRAPNKVGALRTASGSNLLSSESGIQLEIHFDRLARPLGKLFKALFILCRERMSSQLFYRVTGERGESIFGKVNRADLKGQYDFLINVDVLGQSKLEAQQQATLMMQTLLNPAFMQTGIVAPKNLYALAKNFLQKNKVKRVDEYLSMPQDYQEIVTPAERIFRIVTGNIDGLIESVRLDENFDKAMQVMEGFKQSDEYGLLTRPEQVSAFESLIEKYASMQAAQQSGGNPNMSGMQVPRDGFQGLGQGGPSLGAMEAPIGEANGPMV